VGFLPGDTGFFRSRERPFQQKYFEVGHSLSNTIFLGPLSVPREYTIVLNHCFPHDTKK